MLTTKEVRNVKVCRQAKPGKEYKKDGTPRHRHKIGKIFKTVFSTDGLSVVGFIVRQPDLLWMIKRPERFLALDAFDVQDGLVVATKGWDSWDERAIERLGIDYDKCILWEGIYVHDPEGNELGHVDEISFDEVTGEVNSFFLDDGGIARSLVGSVEIPAELVIGYKKGYLVVNREALELTPTGGLAAKAGMATAKASNDVKEVGKKAGEAAGKAVDKGAEGVGKLIGRTKSMVTDTRDAFNKESGAAERAKAKAEKEAQAQAKAEQEAKATKKKSSTSQKSESKGTSSTAKSVSKAASEHLEAAGSMFSNFKKEFDKAKKG
ncbi:MAG: PRC-barrel domain containing protein [Coriobacteriales bacterium]|nr:PRC-barrel domain containing protein [Coriobacteriales bacterium]